MDAPMKALAVTRPEAEYILDCTKVSNPNTRDLALKIAGVVLEFAADDATAAAQGVAGTPAPAVADAPPPQA